MFNSSVAVVGSRIRPGALESLPCVLRAEPFASFIATLPLVGGIFSSCIEGALAKRVESTNDRLSLVQLINQKNRVKETSIKRSIFTIALLVAFVAKGIIPTMVAAVIFSALGTMLIYSVAVNIAEITHNRNVKNQIKKDGVKPWMIVQ